MVMSAPSPGRILWFDNASKQNKAKDWNEQLQEVMSFESVEEFWGLYNKWVPSRRLAAWDPHLRGLSPPRARSRR